MTVLRVKEKLPTHVGSSVSAMRLQLRDPQGAPLASLDDDARPLGYYSPRDGYTLHVVDTDAGSASAAGWLEDVSKVAKYELSDEAYAARDNSYRKFKEEKLKSDPGWTLQKELARRRGVRCFSRALRFDCASDPPAVPIHRRRLRRTLHPRRTTTRRSWQLPLRWARAARCSRAASAAP